MRQVTGGEGVVVVTIKPDLRFLGDPRLLRRVAGIPKDLLEGRRVIPPRGQLIPANPSKGWPASSASAVGR